MTPSAKVQRPHIVSDTAGIRLLGSPQRQAMIDTIVARGPTTVAELSELLRMPADRLYYHVKLLQRRGLLIASGGKTPSGRSEARFDVPGRPVYLRYDPRSPKNRRAVGTAVESLLRTARKDFLSAFQRTDLAVAGKHRNIWSGRVQGNLSQREIAEVNALLEQLIAVMYRSNGQVPPRGRLQQLTFSFSPTGRER